MEHQRKTGTFGVAPVFLTAISTILGAIMFLRFGYAVGNVGFYGTLAIVLIGHLVTIPTAMALAEIATNQKVEGGGEYYIISRSFGINIGAAIGIALYLSQAISVAFYLIAFAEAFEPVIGFVEQNYQLTLDKRVFSLPMLLILFTLMMGKGADMGVKALYAVVATLFASLVMFFIGSPTHGQDFAPSMLTATAENPDAFFYVFAICFPAFTGMTAGVGLSGDLKDPSKSIPLGTLSATIVGMIIYVFIAFKLAISATPSELDGNQLIMGEISVWWPIIPIGLAAATISSALGSIMVAPRTLQALAGDRVFPHVLLNRWLHRGKAETNEPRNATMVTTGIALLFVLMGDVNAVAEIISMFFMVTYGSICAISFFQHFAANPSYRPIFRSKWYLSLFGAVMCVYLMFMINPAYAIAAIIIMTIFYIGITYFTQEKEGMAAIFQGVIFQLSRQLQVFVQKSDKNTQDLGWRPSVVCMCDNSFDRFQAFDLMKWMSYRYGFGTYIHFINGYYSKESKAKSEEALERLISMAGVSDSNVYLDTLISPSWTSAIAQLVQLPGISGTDNNMLLFEFRKGETGHLPDILENVNILSTAGFDMCILASSDRSFGFHREIHVWLGIHDFTNASLMILLAYIILGHPDWKSGQIKLFALYPEKEMSNQRQNLKELVESGRIPISAKNINVLSYQEDVSFESVVGENSNKADLTIVGFNAQFMKEKHHDFFNGFDQVGNVLFVSSQTENVIN